VTVVALAAALVAIPLRAPAQKPGKLTTIGYLRSGSRADAARYGEAFRDGLREFGYVEGRNMTIEIRAAEGDATRLPALAAELLRLSVDVIVAGGSQAIQAAQQATTTVPIVMAVSTDPVGAGFVESLARPGRNITGVSLGAGEQFAGKWVELIKEIVPGVARVAALWDPQTGPHSFVRAAEMAAHAAGVQLDVLRASTAKEVEDAFAAMAARRAQALIVLPSSRFNAQRARIVDLAAKYRLPAVYEHREFVDVGGFMSYGPNRLAMFRRAAYYVDRIVKGARPADLPVEQPRQFELVLNRKTARALGITPSAALLSRVDVAVD
jgi:putative ABC transport system substrate-binding protein